MWLNHSLMKRSWLPLSLLLCLLLGLKFEYLRSALPVIWLVTLMVWWWFFGADTTLNWKKIERRSLAFTMFIVLFSLVPRIIFITDFPQAAYIDEVLTMRNTLHLYHQPLDIFGQTPLKVFGWVETSNLYLYFNLAIVRIFGVNYLSLKLFSILPGVLTCVFFYFITKRLCSPRLSFWIALLFSFSHWHIRLSRYGWDNSFMLMCLTLSVWLLLVSIQESKNIFAYFSGIAGGICFYSYIAGRICLVSLLLFLILELIVIRKRTVYKRFFAFLIGSVITTMPLLFEFSRRIDVATVRMRELSPFQDDDVFSIIIDNIWRHALMFHYVGGIYARDNFPGLPMMDTVSGILLLIGALYLVRKYSTSIFRLVAILFIVNFAGGVFSISPEGGPYSYRTSSTIIPAYILVGFGLQWAHTKADKLFSQRNFPVLTAPLLTRLLLLIIICLNIYSYFYFEANNTLATRVMGYTQKFIGLEIAQDNLPTYLVVPEVLSKSGHQSYFNEKYYSHNMRDFFDGQNTMLAIMYFSGRYNLEKSIAENSRLARIYTIQSDQPYPIFIVPSKIIFHAQDKRVMQYLKSEYPQDSVHVKNISDKLGFIALGVATLGN